MMSSPAKNRLTKQRKLILGMVKAACYHPTAEQIYHLAKKKLPAISVGTVYRNLDVLESQKLVRKIELPGEPARFDAEGRNKAYFVCRKKGVIYDLSLDPKRVKKLFKGHPLIESLDDFNILLFGASKESQDERGMRKGQLKH